MNIFLKSQKKSGFTLIELLVVISIISLLSSVVMASLNTARMKARDAKRRAELKQVQIGLQLYYVTNNGTYPSTGGAWLGGSPGCYTGVLAWIPGLVPTHMPVLPLDPKPISNYGCYLYNSNGVDFKLIAHHTMEVGCPPISNSDSMYDPVRSPTQCTIMITNNNTLPPIGSCGAYGTYPNYSVCW